MLYDYYLAFDIQNANARLSASKQIERLPDAKTLAWEDIIGGHITVFQPTSSAAVPTGIINLQWSALRQKDEKGSPITDPVLALQWFMALRRRGWQVNDVAFRKQYGLLVPPRPKLPNASVRASAELVLQMMMDQAFVDHLSFEELLVGVLTVTPHYKPALLRRLVFQMAQKGLLKQIDSSTLT